MDAEEERMTERDERGTEPGLSAILEAVLFATDRPVTIEQLRAAVPSADAAQIAETLATMAGRYRNAGVGFRLIEAAGGFQLKTAPELHEYVDRFLVGKRRARLSRAAMETLAAVSYYQPMTRGQLEELRGVDCGQVIHTLMDRNLVAIKGRSQALGRPLLYGTTDEFLSYFGLPSLDALPSLEEFQALRGENPLEDPEIRAALLEEGLLTEEESTLEVDAPLPIVETPWPTHPNPEWNPVLEVETSSCSSTVFENVETDSVSAWPDGDRATEV